MKADARPPVHQTKVSTGRKRTEVFKHHTIDSSSNSSKRSRSDLAAGCESRPPAHLERRIDLTGDFGGQAPDLRQTERHIFSLVWAEAQYKRSVSRVYHNRVTGRCSGRFAAFSCVLLCFSVACVFLWRVFVCGVRSSVFSAAVRRVNRAYAHASSRCCRNRCSIGLRARASAARKCCRASAWRLQRCSSSPSAAW